MPAAASQGCHSQHVLATACAPRVTPKPGQPKYACSVQGSRATALPSSHLRPRQGELYVRQSFFRVSATDVQRAE